MTFNEDVQPTVYVIASEEKSLLSVLQPELYYQIEESLEDQSGG